MRPTLVAFLDLRDERDIVLARQRARTVAGRLGFEPQDQIRIATAVSEVARHALRAGEVLRVEFLVGEDPAANLTIRVVGPRPDLDAPSDEVEPRELARFAADPSLAGARRLMDDFRIIPSTAGEYAIAMAKALPRRARPITAPIAAQIADELAGIPPTSPVDELLRQNRELLRLLDDLRSRELELARLNLELEDTNRGVVALYTELDERADSLKQASELKTRFLSNVSHEFRTPLTSIMSMGRLLLDASDGPLNVEQERQVGYILRGAHDLLSLVNDLLDLARIEAGRDEVIVGEVTLPEFFGVMRGMLRPLLPADSPVELVFEVDPEVSPLHTDEGKLAQVVRNLVSNALKFTERGEVRVRASLGTEGSVVIAVSDTGIGIAAADFGRIFEEFGQVDGPLQRQSKGTGLGLPLVRRLIHLLGGKVELASTVGRGSTFTATLPIVYPRPDWAPAAVPQSQGAADA